MLSTDVDTTMDPPDSTLSRIRRTKVSLSTLWDNRSGIRCGALRGTRAGYIQPDARRQPQSGQVMSKQQDDT